MVYLRHRCAKNRISAAILLSCFCLSLMAALGLGLLGRTPPAPAAETTRPTQIRFAERSPADLIQQGRQAYITGQYAAAIQVWREAANQLAAQGDLLGQASVLSHIALAHQQLGDRTLADESIAASLQLLDNRRHTPQPAYWNVRGQAFTTQGSLQFLRSRPVEALSLFQQAADAYKMAENIDGSLRSQINQAQALQALGFYRRALAALTDLEPPLTDRASSLTQVAGLRKLGDLLRITGDIDQSQQVLQQSLALAQQLEAPSEIAQTLFSLGNIARVQGNADRALVYYQQVATLAASSSLTLKANIAQLDLRFETGQLEGTDRLRANIQTQLAAFPLSRATLYAQLDLARSLLENPSQASPMEIAQLLSQALAQSRSLGDRRSESYALGYLGELYAQSPSPADAQPLLEQALNIAQTLNAADIAYRWQWRLGRLHAQQGDLPGAIAAYQNAVKSLQTLRSDLVAINPDIQYDFREKVEPVYRALVNLLLTPSLEKPEISQNRLLQARDVIESLQLAELENFFREPCLAVRQQIDQVVDTASSPTAVIYPIMSPDRLDLILKLPHQPLQHYSSPISQAELESSVETLRRQIVLPYTLNSVQALAAQLYDWLLKPAEASLAGAQIETLVFVLDGALRNIPMAVLYDGQQYLVEKYNLALAPGLKLVDPKPLTERKLAAIAGGLSEARHGFTPLHYVRTEMQQIQSTVDSRVLLDQTFTQAALEAEINRHPFPVVHLATHGQFSSNPEETFILTWDTPIKINTLNRLLRNSEQNRQDAIELLVLSACETAAGDKRAALGLAGVAVRAGARSTLASLWSLDDESSAVLMEQFYQTLTQSPTTKAAALRQAQLGLLQNPGYRHPRYWAPYVLVGNWL